MNPEPQHPDSTPGALDDLLAFYALVPVAADVDLADSLRREGEAAAGSTPELLLDPQGRLTEGQVIGLLEHVLGAELIEELPHRSRKP